MNHKRECMTYELLINRDIKMDDIGIILFCMFMDQDGVKVHEHAQQVIRVGGIVPSSCSSSQS